MRKTVQVLLLLFTLSMLCYFSGLSYFVVCKGPGEQGRFGVLAKIPTPELPQFQESCSTSGFDIKAMVGDSFELVFLGWTVVGAIWILVIMRDISDSLRHWQEYRS